VPGKAIGCPFPKKRVFWRILAKKQIFKGIFRESGYEPVTTPFEHTLSGLTHVNLFGITIQSSSYPVP
jgi:hypothetical protein